MFVRPSRDMAHILLPQSPFVCSDVTETFAARAQTQALQYLLQLLPFAAFARQVPQVWPPACPSHGTLRFHNPMVPLDELMPTLTMVRTRCCEAHKYFGQRCGICPNRPENREAVLKYQQESQSGLGCNLGCFVDRCDLHPSALQREHSEN